MDQILAALTLATLNSKIVDWIKAPIAKRYPALDLWFFTYINGVTGFAIGWFSEMNLLAAVTPNAALGRILTSAAIGAGSWLIYEMFVDKPEPVLIETFIQETGDAEG